MATRTAQTARRLVMALAIVAAHGPVAAQEQEAEPVLRGPVTSLPLPRYVSMRAERANARRGPGRDHRIDWTFVHRGQPLEVTAEYGLWRRVRDADGMGGWVHYSLLSGVRTALITGADPVPLHSAPSEGAAVRAMAEPGAVAWLEACEGAWCEITAGGIDGWLQRSAVWGVDPSETID